LTLRNGLDSTISEKTCTFSYAYGRVVGLQTQVSIGPTGMQPAACPYQYACEEQSEEVLEATISEGKYK